MILKLYVLHILIDYFPLKRENDHGVFCSCYNLQLYIHLIIYLHSYIVYCRYDGNENDNYVNK